MKRNHKLSLITALTAAGLSATSPALALDYEAVILEGVPDGHALSVPGITNNNWGTFYQWHINNAGDVAGVNDIQGDGIGSSNDKMAWRRLSGGSIEVVGQDGGQVPGYPAGTTFTSSAIGFSVNQYLASLADDGSLLYVGRGFGGTGITSGVNDQALILIAPDGSGSAPIAKGNSVPSLGGFITIGSSMFNTYEANRLSSDGKFLTSATIQGPGVNADQDDSVLFYGAPDSYQLVARQGDIVPDGSGDSFGSLGGSHAARGDYYAFVSREVYKVETLYRHGPSGLTKIAGPGTSTGNIFSFGNFNDIQIAPDGTTVFTAEFVETTPHGLYKTTSTGIQALAHDGLASPVAGLGFYGRHDAGSLNTNPEYMLTESGYVAFAYTVTGVTVDTSNNEALWINDADGTRLAFREGDAAGDLAGLTIGGILQFAFNDNQNLVVVSELVGDGVDTTNDWALWLVNDQGNLELILREGDQFDTGVDQRTISSIELGTYSGTSGRVNRSAFNDSDQLLLNLRFDNNGTEGLFLTTVPEPASLGLVLAGGVMLLTVRRRRAS